MHDLRHTAVSLWIAHGASAKQVQVSAGHRSVATVFDRHGHLFPGGEDPVMDSLDAAAPRPPC
jgi:integrase